MPDPSVIKKPGDKVRLGRRDSEEPTIANDWVLIRFEPASGNAILEQAGKRVIVPKDEFEALNFPDSDNLWVLVSADDIDEGLTLVKNAWANNDLPGALGALIKYARKVDPAFAGIQTVSDFIEKAKEQADACQSSLEIMRLDVQRTEREYNHYATATSLEYDHKDNLLSRLRNLEDQYASHKYQCEKLIPAWKQLASALKALDAFVSKARNG